MSEPRQTSQLRDLLDRYSPLGGRPPGWPRSPSRPHSGWPPLLGCSLRCSTPPFGEAAPLTQSGKCSPCKATDVGQKVPATGETKEPGWMPRCSEGGQPSACLVVMLHLSCDDDGNCTVSSRSINHFLPRMGTNHLSRRLYNRASDILCVVEPELVVG